MLFTVFVAACRENNLPPIPAEPTPASVLGTMAPALPIFTPPTVTPELSSANTRLPTVIDETGPSCTAIGQTWTSPLDEMTLVCIPAGEFLMGATANDPAALDNEKPQHQVYLDTFWIDRTEVTNANFARCMADGACRPEVYELSAKTYTPYAVHPDYQDFPVLLHEADVAAAYCEWVGRRLPTEAEWEKAAHGIEVRSYPWGNELDCTKANYYECNKTPKVDDVTGPRCGYSGRCRTVRVDDYSAGASPYGVLNMAGNVWEWVADWYAPDYYAASPSRNPTGPAEGDFKVLRGGGSKSISRDLRVTSRVSGEPQHYFDGQIGFRCAVSVLTP